MRTTPDSSATIQSPGAICRPMRLERLKASPKNCKNSYFYAMSEKRAKDRVILKLLASHGALYSEAEADEFTQPRQPPSNRPPEYDEYGEVVGPVEESIKRDDNIQVLTVDAQRPIFAELERELSACETVDACKRWTVSAKSRASRLSEGWRKNLNQLYLTHLRSLEKRDADEYIERKTG